MPSANTPPKSPVNLPPFHPLHTNHKTVYQDTHNFSLYRSGDDDKPKEECGILACYSKSRTDIAQIMYYGLQALQHRGQESAGIAVHNSTTKKNGLYKDAGVVVNVFNQEIIDGLKGNMGIGHVRYSTVGGSDPANMQPLTEKVGDREFILAHNGTISNSTALKELLEDSGGVTFSTKSDTEVILKVLAGKAKQDLTKAVSKTASLLQGSYSLVALLGDKLIGVRDPFGIRPLSIGQLPDGSYMLASETCAFDAVGAEYIRAVNAGEIVIIDENGLSSEIFTENHVQCPCAFELIYFSRPDSIVDGNSVYRTRINSGRLLHKQHPVKVDVVLSIPQSGTPAGLGYSEASGIPYEMGIVKNQLSNRSFINPTQEMREKEISIKFSVVKHIVKNKSLVVIDDSLVRGNTSRRLITMLRNAGAKEIHFMLASPPVQFPCFFGIDISDRGELAANNRTIDELAKDIGADSLTFLTLDNLKEAFRNKNHCFGCLTGTYPTFAPKRTQ